MKMRRSDDAIRLNALGRRPGAGQGVDWGFVRSVFMRVLGLCWLAKGLYGGASLIGMFGLHFDSLDATAQASAVFSVIGDCIAGVGLWLTVSWGAVTWIAVVLVESAFLLSQGSATAQVLLSIVPIGAYLGLSLLSTRQAYERM